MSEIKNNPYWPSICDSIKNNKNKSLSFDKEICCDNDDICSNIDNYTCYFPNKLVQCHRVGDLESSGACQRKDMPNLGDMNNDEAKKICKEENLDKHFCLSTNSTTFDPNMDGELSWVVGRKDANGKTLGPSCQACVYCDPIYSKKCARPITHCNTACNSSLLKQIPEDIFPKTPREQVIGMICPDMFNSRICRLYNIITGEEIITGDQKGPLWYQSELCDFTIPPDPSPGPKLTPPDPSPGSKLTPDGIAGLITSIVAIVIGIIGIINRKWIRKTWKKFRNGEKTNDQSGISNNNGNIYSEQGSSHE